jgi:hypothetical protein
MAEHAALLLAAIFAVISPPERQNGTSSVASPKMEHMKAVII